MHEGDSASTYYAVYKSQSAGHKIDKAAEKGDRRDVVEDPGGGPSLFHNDG